MIAELEDGREFKFPEGSTPEQVGAFVRALLASEARVKALQTDVEALRAKLDALLAQPRDKGVVEELRGMRADLNAGVKSITEAQLADRILVADEYGETNRSRAVKRSR